MNSDQLAPIKLDRYQSSRFDVPMGLCSAMATGYQQGIWMTGIKTCPSVSQFSFCDANPLGLANDYECRSNAYRPVYCLSVLKLNRGNPEADSPWRERGMKCLDDDWRQPDHQRKQAHLIGFLAVSSEHHNTMVRILGYLLSSQLPQSDEIPPNDVARMAYCSSFLLAYC